MAAMPTAQELRKQAEFRAQVHLGVQQVLAALDPYDRSIRGIILGSIETELAIRSAAQEAVHSPEWFAKLQDETPVRLELPGLDPVSG